MAKDEFGLTVADYAMNAASGKSSYNPSAFRTYDNSYGGALDSYGQGKNGNMIKMDGWGMDAAGLGMQAYGMYNQNQAQKDMLAQREKEQQFQQEQYYNNMAMKLSGFREHWNGKNEASAYVSAANAGSGAGFDRNQWNQSGAIIDENGGSVADPINLNTMSGAPTNVQAAQAAGPAKTTVGAAAAATTESNKAAGMSSFVKKKQGDQAKKKTDKQLNNAAS